MNQSFTPFTFRVQGLGESRGGRPGLSALMRLMVSVDVKQHWTVLTHWSQFVPNNLADIRGHEALQHHLRSQPRPSMPTTTQRHHQSKRSSANIAQRPIPALAWFQTADFHPTGLRSATQYSIRVCIVTFKSWAKGTHHVDVVWVLDFS